MNIQIRSRVNDTVLFEHNCENNSMRLTVELALKSGANLSRADLFGADLSYANLFGADLSGANLSYADLSGADLSYAGLSYANLSGTDLSGASLSYANLSGANLSGTNLSGASLSYAGLSGTNLSGANLSRANLSYAGLSGATIANGDKLVGARPIFQIGPIGSQCAYFTAYITDKGLRFDAGCQRQITRETFEEGLSAHHCENEYAKEYRAALALIDAHAEIWTPGNGQ